MLFRSLPVDEIKIDKSFVAGMLNDEKDTMVVRSIIELGHNLGLRVVAEGVENLETLDALAVLGCDEAQGYYINQPQACGVLKEWFAVAPWKIGPND